MIEELKVIDSYCDEDTFIMCGIAGHAIRGTYKSDGLLLLVGLIHENEPFSIRIDQERTFFVPVELNKQIKKELSMIAAELERGSNR